MKRIVVVGSSGAGKTTLGHALGLATHIPVHDLDEYYWLVDWQPSDDQVFQERIVALTKQTDWIICGNFTKVRPIIWQSADTIIWLDYSFITCFRQLLKRSLRRVWYKQLSCNGNQETWRRFVSKDSILLWMVKEYSQKKETYKQLFNKPVKDKTYLRFTNPLQTQVWLEKIKQNS